MTDESNKRKTPEDVGFYQLKKKPNISQGKYQQACILCILLLLISHNCDLTYIKSEIPIFQFAHIVV